MISFSGIIKKVNGRKRRSAAKAALNLGVIEIDLAKNSKKYRDPALEALDAYYENRQYDHLPDWDSGDPSGDYIEIRNRKPRIQYPFARTLAQRIVSLLIGGHRFPQVMNPDFPDDQEYLRAVVKQTRLASHLVDPLRILSATGSVFVRFYLVGGKVRFDWYHAKYCYPKFDEAGDLESIEIKYVYVDKDQRDEQGDFKKLWFKMYLDQNSEIIYDNPECDFNTEEEPKFTEVERVDHQMGFVQGVWFKLGDKKGSPDGTGFICDLMDFIDEFNYSISQSSSAVGYNQDPILALKGMDEEEIGELVRSSSKSLNLGRDGSGQFLESSLSGVDKAVLMRDKVKTHIQDIARVVILDPEKIIGSAQSAKAMEVLHGPMIDLVIELRGIVEPMITEMIQKLAATMLIARDAGIPTPINIPDDYAPQSLSFIFKWKQIFEQTLQDLQAKVSLATSAATARIISNETAMRFLAEDFGIEDIQAELDKIAAQPVLNPFGGF